MSANTESVVSLTERSSPSASREHCSSSAVSFPPMLALYFRSPSEKESRLLGEKKREKETGEGERERERGREGEREVGRRDSSECS